jgi:hypothetical protein
LVEKLGLGISPGFIFFWNQDSIRECLEKGILGTVAYLRESVNEIRVGDIGFLYHYNADTLHGIWEATSNGGYFDPTFCLRFGRSLYPSQVKVRRLAELHIHDARAKLSKNPYNKYIVVSKKYLRTKDKIILLKPWQVAELGELLVKEYSPRDCASFLASIIDNYGEAFAMTRYPDCWACIKIQR